MAIRDIESKLSEVASFEDMPVKLVPIFGSHSEKDIKIILTIRCNQSIRTGNCWRTCKSVGGWDTVCSISGLGLT